LGGGNTTIFGGRKTFLKRFELDVGARSLSVSRDSLGVGVAQNEEAQQPADEAEAV
jgi:hypothetical protein